MPQLCPRPLTEQDLGPNRELWRARCTQAGSAWSISSAQGQTHWGIPAEFNFTSGPCRSSLGRGYTKGQVSHWTWEPPHLLTLITIWMHHKMELAARGRHRRKRVQVKPLSLFLFWSFQRLPFTSLSFMCLQFSVTRKYTCRKWYFAGHCFSLNERIGKSHLSHFDGYLSLFNTSSNVSRLSSSFSFFT